MRELSRLGIYGLWRDKFKDLFPTLFLMPLGSSSSSFFPYSNIEKVAVVLQAVLILLCLVQSNEFVQEKKENAVWLIPRTNRRWLRSCALHHQVFGSPEEGSCFYRMSQRVGGGSCYFCLGSKGYLGAMCKGKGAESHWACLGLWKDSSIQKEGWLSIIFHLWEI